MSDLSSYDPIKLENTTFDLIVIGTGFHESVIAAAASSAGKTVLHLDQNDFYGSHFNSLHLNDLTSFLNSHATPVSTTPDTTSTSSSHDYTALSLNSQSLYSNIENSNYAPEILAEHSKKFYIDLGGPRLLFCADKAIDLIIKSGVNSYMDFKSINASFICDESGELWNVPDSRSAIFKDRSLSLIEKNQLMRFFKLVQQHLAASEGGDEGSESSNISEDDLESPLVDFLKRMRLPPKIKSIILYSISMLDYDQDNLDVCKTILKTRDGIERLALYQKSVGRFSNAPGAFLYPLYGNGEFSQAFSRRAAVKGCIQVLHMPVTALLVDKTSGQYKGVRLASGEDYFSHRLVMDPTFTLPFPAASSAPDLRKSHQVLTLKDDQRKVARGICITTSSLRPDIANLLLVYPPRSLFPEQDTSIRAVQIGGGLEKLAVCPSGMFLLYFSSLCDDDEHGKRLLHAAMNALLTLIPVSANPESGSTIQSEDAEVKPILLWSLLYIQELSTLHTGEHDNIIATPMPDGNLNYNEIIDSTITIFQKMFPDEAFFPETPSSPEVPENPEGDTELSLDG